MEGFGKWNLEPGFWKLKQIEKNEKDEKDEEKEKIEKKIKKKLKNSEKTISKKIRKFSQRNNTSRQMHWRTAAVRSNLHSAVVMS